ncbi:MAG: alpha/beta hydrolase, partial [Chitinophagales bacterium]
MKTIPCLFLSYLFVCLSPYISFAQNCEDCRYLTEIFDSIQITENIKFGQGVNAVGDTQELFLDIYQPVGDTVQNRPVLLFAFGGAFIRGSKEESYVIKACERYAKAGYVAAAMDYRIGFEVDLNLGDVAMRVFFRAMQDMRASVEYFYYSAKNGNPYAVDTNLIFLGGASAGAISALFMEYCDHPDKIAEIGDTTKLAPLGGFSASSSIFPRQSREVAGILNVAGAL